ncbi:MAG: dicarboxylate/amino acid:cation symporter [Planctomycetota bacterium]|nr:dicarboxylate/amino acid:cation symporter [Planctomycetota bacterium]
MITRLRTLPLHLQILIALFLGVVLGLSLNRWYGMPRVVFQEDNVRIEITEDIGGISILREGSPPIQASDIKTLKDHFPESHQLFLEHRPVPTPALRVALYSKWLGDLFLRLLRMVTVPLIFTSLVTGVAGLGSAQRLGRMFSLTLGYYLLTSLLAITVGIVMVNLIRPGIGAELPIPSSHGTVTHQALSDVFGQLLGNMIPVNPVASLANADFLSIITFALLFGLFIVVVGGESGELLRKVFAAGFDVMMAMTTSIIRLAPVGVFAYMLYATAGQGVQVFYSLAWYMLTVFLALTVHAFVVLPTLIKWVAGRSPLQFIQAMSPALMTAFSTASSNGTLPLTMASVEKRAGVKNRISSFVLPLGATVNMDGTALYEVVAVLFIAQATGHDIGLSSQIVIAVTALLASIGAAGIPHAGLVMMAIVLQAANLPVEAQGLIIAVDRVLDMCRTTVNVWSDSTGCAVIARFEGRES